MRRAFADADAAEIVFVAQQQLQAGAWDQARALCEAFPELDAPALRLCRAVASFVSGDSASALRLVAQVLAQQPPMLSALAVQAQILARTGQGSAALRPLAKLLEIFPDYPGAQSLLGALLFPGPHYRDVLAACHARLQPRAYLEIGVDTGATLILGANSEIAIGVDPAEVRLQKPLPSCARLYRFTSDDFFAHHTREHVFAERHVDLTFIDGMHRLENALADFMHAEAWSHPDATVVFHDCLPLHPVTAARERRSNFWVGDTWKVVLALASARPDLRIRSIPCAPSGLVIVRRLNPASRILAEQFDDIVARLAPLTWDHPLGEFPSEFGLVSNDAAGLADAVA
ncbi:MAG: class I SAM-dependent methyltransferase [Myxococcota bacterium]